MISEKFIKFIILKIPSGFVQLFPYSGFNLHISISVLSQTQVYEWHKALSEGREVMKSNCFKRIVHPPLLENHHVDIKEIAEDLRISYEVTQLIFG